MISYNNAMDDLGMYPTVAVVRELLKVVRIVRGGKMLAAKKE